MDKKRKRKGRKRSQTANLNQDGRKEGQEQDGNTLVQGTRDRIEGPRVAPGILPCRLSDLSLRSGVATGR